MDYLTLEPTHPAPTDTTNRNLYRWCQFGAHWYRIDMPNGTKKGSGVRSNASAQACFGHRDALQRAKKAALRDQMGGSKQLHLRPTNPTEYREEIRWKIYDTLRIMPARPHPNCSMGLKSDYEAGWPMACNECEHGCLPSSHVPGCKGCACHD